MGVPWVHMQVSHCPQRTWALAAAALEAATWRRASLWELCSRARPPLARAVSIWLMPAASCMACAMRLRHWPFQGLSSRHQQGMTQCHEVDMFKDLAP